MTSCVRNAVPREHEERVSSPLRSCPFCGGRPSLGSVLREGYEQIPEDPDARAYYYVCDSCAATGGWGKTETQVRRLWNMRVKPDSSEGPS